MRVLSRIFDHKALARVSHPAVKYAIFGATLAILISIYGIAGSIGSYQRGLDFGDGATFHEFARNIANGESIYKDFIHFRTPGSYFIWAPFIVIFGDHQSSISLAINIETRVLYPLIFLLSALIIFRNLRQRYLFTLISLFVIFLPPIAQLRAGFALLAIAVYMLAISSKAAKKRNWYYALSGAVAGVGFIFGQETAVMAISVIAVSELFELIKSKSLSNILRLLGGFGAALSPLLVYILLYSSVKNFLYYTLYYSFVQQPKFMDIAYPTLSYSNLIYYLPFLLYFLLFTTLFFSNKPKKEYGVLLAFAFMRTITALGRSDILHLFFSVGEACIVTPLIAGNIQHVEVTRVKLRSFVVYGSGLILIIVLAICLKSMYMFLASIIIIASLKASKDTSATLGRVSDWVRLNLYAAICCSVVMMAYLSTPSIKNSLSIFVEVVRGDRFHSSYMISGKYVDKTTYDEVDKTIQEIDKIHPRSIFSFPIQPFYYTLSKNHASRFITFEPQITDEEELQTIQDIKNAHPGVIIFDPLQAEALSGSLEQINRFILENYKISAVIKGKNIVWVMVPDEAKSAYPLLFDLKFSNANTKSFGIQSAEKGINNAVAQRDQHLEFDTRSSKKLEIEVKLIEGQENFTPCGVVKLLNDDGSSEEHAICAGQGRYSFDVAKTRSIELTNNDSQKIVLWNNILID